MNLSKYQDEEVIVKLLRESKTVAVVGVSENISRPSHRVASYIMKHGYKMIPVNPQYDSVLGEKSYSNLHEIDEPVDIVDIFRNPATVLPIVSDAIEIGAKAVWFQEGVINEEAAALAADAGLSVVMDRCILKEHWRLIDPDAS